MKKHFFFFTKKKTCAKRKKMQSTFSQTFFSKKVCVLSILVLALTLIAVPAAATENVLYIVPQHSSTPYCNNVDVNLMADVNESNPIIATAVNVTFDPNCIEITNWAGNSSIWTGGTTSTIAWSIPHGFIKITTAKMGGVSGSLNLGTLTLHCNSTGYCKSNLNFAIGEYTKEDMETIYPEVQNGTFTCGTPTLTPTSTPSPTPTPTPSPATGGAGDVSSPGVPSPTPSPSPTPAVTSTPLATSTPLPAPTSTPSPALAPTPTPTPMPGLPGFEAAFVAIAFLFLTSYFMLLKKKEKRRR